MFRLIIFIVISIGALGLGLVSCSDTTNNRYAMGPDSTAAEDSTAACDTVRIYLEGPCEPETILVDFHKGLDAEAQSCRSCHKDR